MVSPQPNKTNSTVINTRCSVRPSVRRHLCGLDPLPLYLHGWWRYTEGGTKATTMAFNKARRASRQTIPSSQNTFLEFVLPSSDLSMYRLRHVLKHAFLLDIARWLCHVGWRKSGGRQIIVGFRTVQGRSQQTTLSCPPLPCRLGNRHRRSLKLRDHLHCTTTRHLVFW